MQSTNVYIQSHEQSKFKVLSVRFSSRIWVFQMVGFIFKMQQLRSRILVL